MHISGNGDERSEVILLHGLMTCWDIHWRYVRHFESAAERHQQRERDEKLHRRRQPQPVPHLRGILPERDAASPPRPQTASIATSDSRMGIICRFSSALFRQTCGASSPPPERRPGQFARFHQMRHHRLRPPAKQPQQFIDQPPARGFRETTASKICALLIFFTRRSAPFSSMR